LKSSGGSHYWRLSIALLLICLAGCPKKAKKSKPAGILVMVPKSCVTKAVFQPANCQATATADWMLCDQVIVHYACVEYGKQ
jgi:hypothetical protein